MILGHTVLVILENAVFPPRESQKSLGGKVGDGKGVAVQMKRNENTRPSTAVSDLAEAAVTGEESVSLMSKGLGARSGGGRILPGLRPPGGRPWGPGAPPHPGQVFGFSGVTDALMQPWARSVESGPNPDARQLAPRWPTRRPWQWPPRQARTGRDPAHRIQDVTDHRARLCEESAGLASCVGH